MFKQVESHRVTTGNGERKQDANHFDEVYEDIINNYVAPDEYEDDKFSTQFGSGRNSDTARST